MKDNIVLYFFDFLFIFGGIGIVIGSIFLNNKSNYYKENGILIEATVIEITNVYSSIDDWPHNHTNYTADVEYFVNNQKYKAIYKTTNYIEKGDIVEIYYDKNNPQDNWHNTSNVGPILMMIMGLICFIVGCVFLISLRKTRNI